MPADAFTFPPFDPTELVHHLEALAPAGDALGDHDDLTGFSRRRAIMAELDRRLAASDRLGAGLLSLREPETYRQDSGRAGVDEFVALVSVVLRRHAEAGPPVMIGYLEDGAFLILGAPSVVHHLIARTIRDVEALVPASYEADTLFTGQEANRGPETWVSLEGTICLVEPGRFDNAAQVGFILADAVGDGRDALRQVDRPSPRVGSARLVAD